MSEAPIPIADREARLIYLREFATAPPLFLPPRWADAPPEIKAECRKKAGGKP